MQSGFELEPLLICGPDGAPRPSAWTLVLLWTGVGLVFATTGGSVKQALTTWYLWDLLGWALVAIDRGQRWREQESYNDSAR